MAGSMKHLCFRCEFRARFLEAEHEKRGSGHAPRYECGTGSSVNSCYMFKPVQPLVLELSDYEKTLAEKGIVRPIGGILGGRLVVSKEQPEFDVFAEQEDERFYIYNKRK
jgi:hypothetical protein